MRSSLKGIAENVLFAFIVFIIFLLAVGNQLVIPQWLQPVGRMHPMLLHFPIAILMLAFILEFFRFHPEEDGQKFFQNFVANLVLVGALTSALTVVMGLFLSKEEGYEGNVLQWHKWTGVATAFLSAVIYWAKKYAWYNPRMAKAGAAVSILCLLGAGHYGATLTHGENYVLGPVLPKPAPVSINEAVVFTHLVQPIFEKKCVSCHSPEKIKGKLMLTDAESVKKGGKSGKLIVPGDPKLSLLLQRVHLPDEDKKHMPPKNKEQLTDDEIALLTLWIKKGADYEKKVATLPATDSLRVLASSFLAPASATEETFAFAAAGEETIRKLNTNYRVIYPYAKNSPALSVTFYNKSTYQPKLIEELSDIKKQVVSLSLNKMPVKDAELKSIAQFENLKHLNLNFTDITGDGLKELARLKHLESLSLSGTKLKPGALQQIASLKTLNRLAIWRSGITNDAVEKIKKSNPSLSILTGFSDNGENVIKLSPPELKNNSSFFKKSVLLQLKHPIAGTEIRYTTDGSTPDSLKAKVYDGKAMLSGNATVKARAFKKGWLGSDEVSFNFYKSLHKPDSIKLLTAPNERYYGDHEQSLTDEVLGTFDVLGGQWLGYLERDMEVYVSFNQPELLQSVGLNIMQNTGGGLFPPQSVEVWGGTDPKSMRKLSVLKPPVPGKDDPGKLGKIECRFKPQKLTCLKIVAKPLAKMPEWHGNKGKTAWLFVDELMLN